jgi:AmiR/NasT family two-component response regulator
LQQTGCGEGAPWSGNGSKPTAEGKREDVSQIGYDDLCDKPISSTNPFAVGSTWLGMAANKDEGDLERLRILVSDGKGHRLEEVTATVTSLGHEVVGHSSLGGVAASTASIRPDAAIVIVGESSERALELIGRTVTEAACPVIAILDVEDEAFIRDAAKRGIFAYITVGRDASALQSSLDVVLSRFAEYQGLQGAFARRAITERAKGILMERHSIDEQLAFEILRDEARRSNRKLIEIAEAVTMSVNLLPRLSVE